MGIFIHNISTKYWYWSLRKMEVLANCIERESILCYDNDTKMFDAKHNIWKLETFMNIWALLSLVTAVESIFYKKEKNRKVLQDDIPDRAGLTYIAYFFLHDMQYQ